MNNRSALITGGAKRIGKEIALNLATKGFNIAIHYNNSEHEVVLLKEKIEKLGVRAEIFQANLSENCYENLIKDVVEVFPNLDILINNASIFVQTPFLETSLEELDNNFNINFKAPFFLTQNFAKIQKSGAVINILDSRIAKGSSNYFTYLLSKQALHDFTLGAAKELGKKIRINGISPGITELSDDMDEETFQRMVDSSPLQQVVKIKEIVDAVDILINNESFTGQNLFIDSGANL